MRFEAIEWVDPSGKVLHTQEGMALAPPGEVHGIVDCGHGRPAARYSSRAELKKLMKKCRPGVNTKRASSGLGDQPAQSALVS